jgi:hypothetical protein
VYFDTLQGFNGCDSILILTLTVNPAYNDTLHAEICAGDSLFWQGNYHYIPGTYYDSLLSNWGCDSIFVLYLTVNIDYLFLENQDICNGETYLWFDTLYHQSGIYYHILQTTTGCDSIYILDLNVIHVDTTVVRNGFTLTAAPGSDSYQWVDCNNGYAAIPGQQSNSFTATSNGHYAVIITYDNCTDTSSCHAITGISIDKPTGKSEMKIYPNPNSGIFSLVTPAHSTLLVWNSIGMIVYRQELPEGIHQIDLSVFPAGIYTIQSIYATETRTHFVIIRH